MCMFSVLIEATFLSTKLQLVMEKFPRLWTEIKINATSNDSVKNKVPIYINEISEKDFEYKMLSIVLPQGLTEFGNRNTHLTERITIQKFNRILLSHQSVEKSLNLNSVGQICLINPLSKISETPHLWKIFHRL